MRAEEISAPATDRPAPRGGGRQRLAVAAAALAAFAFCGATMLPPLLEGARRDGAALLRLAYAPLCHQDADRSLALAGAPLAVCARCSGIYLGAAVGLALAVGPVAGKGRRPRPIWLAVALAPTVADALAARVGLPSLANGPRLALAVPLGLIAGLFLAVGVADLAAAD